MSNCDGRRGSDLSVRVVAGRLVAAALVAMVLALPRAWAREEVSGRLVNGFRVLSEQELTAFPEVTVYRGDYIKFEIKDLDTGENKIRFSVPALDIDAALPARPGQPVFFKMKQTGEFAYSLGKTRGTLRVIEYDGVHYQALTATEAQKIMAELDPLILDVRTPGEFKAARIEGAKLLPVQVLQQNLSVLADYKEDPILIYCATGNRSTVAAKILIDNGFKRIFNLKKGIKDWAGQKLPITK